jgi:DNA-binding NarL/FixJ family response regulator
MATEPAEAQGQIEQELDSGGDRIRVIVADSEPIFRVGMRKIFALEDDLRVMAQTETLAQTETAVQRHPTDVLLMEAGIAVEPAESVAALLQLAPKLKVVLIVADQDETEILEYVRRGACGVVPRSISPDLLIKCIRKVAAGETWLDNRCINLVIEAYRAQAMKLISPKTRTKLSNKEMMIISGVTQGLRNKEIATDVGTTEQVVKNYLRKIYDKLGVSDRLELALYCMHHKLLGNSPSVPETPAAPAAPAADSISNIAGSSR